MSPIISTSLSSPEPSSLDFNIRSSDETLLNMVTDDWAFTDFPSMEEYSENARSESLLFPDGLLMSLREKSTGSAKKKNQTNIYI